MPRDIFGNLTKTDVFGRKISKNNLKEKFSKKIAERVR